MTPPPWFAVIQYAGGSFAGWQRQPEVRTVQGVVEDALKRLHTTRVPVHAAGRTDTGVHALAQVLSFAPPRDWEPDALHRAINALLPPDVWVVETGPAPDGFHARRQATARRYRYVIGCDAAARSPFRAPYEWALTQPLDEAALDEVARAVRGAHDFRALSTTGQTKPHYRCVVATAEWRERRDAEGFIFEIEADRFLHRMVRFIVGLAVDAGRGRRPAADAGRLLAGTDNREASPPAPPEGLYLTGVHYPHFAKGFDAP